MTSLTLRKVYRPHSLLNSEDRAVTTIGTPAALADAVAFNGRGGGMLPGGECYQR